MTDNNLTGICICKKQALFTPYIVYKNETVFKAYEGAVIARCKNCGCLKTFALNINPETSKIHTYEERKERYRALFQPIIDQIGKHVQNGLALDVGCASGILMELIREMGLDVYGIEPNHSAYKVAVKRFPKKIHCGYMDDYAQVQKKRFDVIIYNHVLEHVTGPKSELEHIKKLLKPGRYLIIGVPNRNNIIFFLRKKYWELLLPDQHIWHFSFADIKALLTHAGFTVKTVSYTNATREDYPMLKKIYFRFLTVINTAFGTGEAMLVTAQKK